MIFDMCKLILIEDSTRHKVSDQLSLLLNNKLITPESIHINIIIGKYI